MTTQCEHLHIQYDKINDYNYCEDCMYIFIDDSETLYNEEETVVIDERAENLKKLNLIQP